MFRLIRIWWYSVATDKPVYRVRYRYKYRPDSELMNHMDAESEAYIWDGEYYVDYKLKI